MAKKSIDLFLGAPSEDKILSCYGGEPLLQFPLLKKIVLYSRKLARARRKRLRLVVCSNGHLLTDEHLEFFRRLDVRVHISLFAEARVHRKYRGPGFSRVRGALRRASAALEEGMAGACFCVTPATVGTLAGDLTRVCAMSGVKLVNLELITRFQPWRPEDVDLFAREFRKVAADIRRGIKARRPFFLNLLCWKLKFGERVGLFASQDGPRRCPFLRQLEVSPQGAIAFSPFYLYAPRPVPQVLGNIMDSATAWWGRCSFIAGSGSCRQCFARYMLAAETDDGSGLLFKSMNAIADGMVADLRGRAGADPRYAQYIRDAVAYAS